MEYQQIVAATERQFQDEERDIEARQAEMDAAQALLDRRRRALKRKRTSFERLMRNYRDLDVEGHQRQAGALRCGRRRRGPGRRAAGAGRRRGGCVRNRMWAYSCRACAARVVQSGGRRRRLCDGCLARIAFRMRRQGQGGLFMRRFDGVQRPR